MLPGNAGVRRRPDSARPAPRIASAAAGRAILALALVLLAPPGRAAELLVHAAASLTEALGEIARRHEAATGVRVRVDLGSSSTLARQVLEGAPGDVVFLADDAQADRLARAGLIDVATRRSLLSNALAVVVPAEDGPEIGCSRDLVKGSVKSVALADPGSVPAGRYAMAHLRRIGAWEAVRPKVVPTEHVRAALAAVAAGNVDAAIVYATDARSSKAVRVACLVPADEAPDISYPVAVLTASEHPREARAFLATLASREAAAVFEGLGFIVRP